MEEGEQYEQQQGTSSIPHQSMVTEGMLKEQMVVVDILANLEKTLLGKEGVYDEDNNFIGLSKADPKTQLINEIGCKSLMLDLGSRLTKIFQLSHFEDEMIYGLAKIFSQNVRESLFQHWDEWAVRSTTAASKITNLMHDTFLSTLRKAHKGKYLQYLANVYSAEDKSGYYPGRQQQNKSMVDKIMGKFR